MGEGTHFGWVSKKEKEVFESLKERIPNYTTHEFITLCKKIIRLEVSKVSNYDKVRLIQEKQRKGNQGKVIIAREKKRKQRLKKAVIEIESQSKQRWDRAALYIPDKLAVKD